MLLLFLSMIEDDEHKEKFNKIYHTYHDKLFSVAMAITKNFHAAEDALQNALYIIAKNIQKIKTDDEKLLRSFLYAVVRNSSINLCRTRKCKNFDSLEALPDQATEEDFIKNIEGDEQYLFLVKSILSLPNDFKDVIVLNLLDGLSCSEISKLLSINKNTVKSRLTRAKKLLQKIITEAKIK